MIDPGAEQSIENINLKGPLAGIPISLKDTIVVGGFDTSVGYSRYTGKPYPKDGTMARILKDAGKVAGYIEGLADIQLLRSRPLREDKLSHHLIILRVNQRCLGPHNQPSQY